MTYNKKDIGTLFLFMRYIEASLPLSGLRRFRLGYDLLRAVRTSAVPPLDIYTRYL